MGTVRKYQCPWCRWTDFTRGYAPDGVDYRICTQGPFSCLWHHWLDSRRKSKTVVDLFDNGWALHYVFLKKFDVGWCTRVWQFCAGPSDAGKNMDRLAGETDELPSGWIDVTDELACVSGSLLHAEALRNTQETWGRMPVQLFCGDSYQLPPVPASSSLLAPTTKQTDVVQVHDGANQPVVRLEPVQPHQPHYPPLHPDELFDAWKAWKKERGRA
jgi:hypothetical protein